MYAWVYYVIVLLAAYFIAQATAPKPPDQPPAALEDVDAPTAEEGKPIGVAFGTVWCKSPNVVWYGDLYTRPIIRDSGKK